jgi:membrane-associated protein
MPSLTSLIAHWGYAAIFLIVVLGNVGVPVPEETALIVAGYLVWQGQFRLPLVLAVGIVSAVAGDNMGYWLGRRYGRRVVNRITRWGQVPPERLEAMQRILARYGPLGVFAGRFLPGLRFLAGPLAGATGLGFRPFFVANVLGAALFVPYGVGLGYAIGYGLGPYVARLRLAERLVLLGLIIAAGALVGRRVWGSRGVSSRR